MRPRHATFVVTLMMLLIATAALTQTPERKVGLSASFSHALSDTLVDVMPLSVGNRWTYRYYTSVVDWDVNVFTDSGVATYEVVAVNPQPDSIVWTVSEHRQIRRCYNYYFDTPPDTCWLVTDSTSFPLTEQRIGRHRFFRNAAESQVWESAFPWSRELIDPTALYRYADVDSAGGIAVDTKPPGPSYERAYHLTFQRGVGQTRARSETGPTIAGVIYSSDHVLLGSIINSAPDDRGTGEPTGFQLGQNYPNPFNSSTTITFHLAAASSVRLRVFDVLGRVVATLIDATLPSGSHRVSWDASRLASGIYLYRLDAGGTGLVKRALLLR